MVQLYGDTRVVRRHYESLRKFMGYLDKTAKDHVRGTGAYGDWLRLAGPQHSDAIGTAYYFYAARLMSDLAAAIGEKADAEQYRDLAEKIRAVFVVRFIKDDGRIVDSKNETGQTFYALAFGLDLVPADHRDAVAKQFVAEIEKQKNHLATGFLGTPFVLFALQKAGRADLAYQMVLNEDYPSWLLQVKLGSTTMWERWDGWLPDKGFQDAGMNSFNHYWLGCVGEWLKCVAAGIDTDGPGFARITIRPTLDPSGKGFRKVEAHYDSIRGRIESEWELEDGGFELETTIPANTTATIFVPAKDAASVEEGGRPAAKAKGLKFLRFENGCAVYEAGSGEYEFESRL
jgi:alpha-L-rhamnosidase